MNTSVASSSQKSLQDRNAVDVFGARIDTLTWDHAMTLLDKWAAKNESRYVCLCNVHSVVTAHNDDHFRAAINRADLATPDGMPIAWLLRKRGWPSQERINGPDLMWRYLARASENRTPIFLYGGTWETLEKLHARLREQFPELIIAGMYSPPFRKTTTEEDIEIAAHIEASGAKIVFISLGCPKQELWMEKQRGRLRAVMVGVGAAFDYHAGVIRRAPKWMQAHGLEWLYRLITEPRRLWRRYFTTNLRFIRYVWRDRKRLYGANRLP